MGKTGNITVLTAIVILLGAVGCYYEWISLLQDRDIAWQTGMNQALSAHSSKQDAAAEAIFETLLPKTEKWWPDSPRLIEIQAWLGTIDRVQHKYEIAEPILRRAVELAEEQKATSTTDVGRAKMNLGLIARDRPDDVEAERLFSEALQILSQNPGAAWGDDDACLLNLGYLATKEGRYQDAVSYLKQAVAGYQNLFGKKPDPDFANAHIQLADAYRHLDDYPNAATHYEAALKIYEQIEGPQGRDVASSLSGLAVVQNGHRTADRAQALLEHVLPSTDMADGDGTALNDLANIASDRKQYAKAESLYLRACPTYEKSEGPEKVALSTALSNLGKLYRDHQQFDIRKAEPPLKRALAIREKALGPEHPQTAEALSDLSLLYFYEKNYAEAEAYARRALPIEQKTFGADGLEVSTTLNRLGISERELGKFKEAEFNLKRALAIREAKHAPDNWIAISLENLACVYSVQGETAQAQPLMARAQALRSHSSSQ